MSGMLSVSRKPETLRTARAEAILRVRPETIELVRAGKTPKADVLAVARTAATLAAKKTSEMIPYCHNIPLDHIDVTFSLEKDSIRTEASVATTWKTGVEMEAITCAAVAAVTLYDMLKPVDSEMEVSRIRLLEKHGGIADFQEDYGRKLRATVLVISDSVHEGSREDKSGKTISRMLEANGVEVADYHILPDDREKIEHALKKFSDQDKMDFIITTGGTGVGPRDFTPEATRNVLDKELTGVAESLRVYGQRRTPLAMLSRAVAGVRGNTVIVNMPGGTKAVTESMEALFPGVLHTFKMLKGKGHG